MELRIDAKDLLKQALAEVHPGEDIDEAILRVCKTRYPDRYTDIFPELLQMLELVDDTVEGSRLDRVHQLVETPGTMTMTLHSTEVMESEMVSERPADLLDRLPRDVRTEFRKALADQKGATRHYEKRVFRRTAGGGRELMNCRCGFLGPPEEGRCPKCGRPSD